MKKKLLIIICFIVVFAGAYLGFNVDFDIEEIENTTENSITENNVVEETTEVIENEVIITEQTEELVIQTKEAIENDEDLSTSEEIESSEEEEQSLEEEDLEVDAQVEQEDISYDGTNTGNGLSLLGTYQGLTYYSQIDSRWKNVLYTSTGNSSQTIGSSGCGVTAGAMVVSSSKGTILPTVMASLAVENGYRTANNGTAWAFYPFIADYFNFSEYHSTSSFDTALKYLETDNDNDGNSDYYVVVSCGSGLFTTGGHYIVLVADNDGTLTVYDPYLYNGKFTTASRKNVGVVVSGNNVYVTESSFKTYANARNFWIFSNDEGSGNTATENTISYTRYISTQNANLRVRSEASTSSSIITTLAKGTQVTVTKVDGNWSYITSPVQGWVSSSYLSSTKVTTTNTTINYSTIIGNYYRLKNKAYIYSSSNLSGTKYTYLAQTQIKVLSHVSSTVDYVQVVKTGRKGYVNININNYATTSTTSSTVGQYKRLASKTYLYSNSSLSGTKYTYLANTQVKIIKNISSSVDYVYVVKTGRYAYVNSNSYK